MGYTGRSFQASQVRVYMVSDDGGKWNHTSAFNQQQPACGISIYCTAKAENSQKIILKEQSWFNSVEVKNCFVQPEKKLFF